MIDLYLKFESKEDADSVLFLTREGEKEPVQAYKNIDVIGTVYKPTGKTITRDGIKMPAMAAIPGWHVNVRLLPDEDGTPLEKYRINPSTPSRVWA